MPYVEPQKNEYPPNLPEGRKSLEELTASELEALDVEVEAYQKSRVCYTNPHRLTRHFFDYLADLYRQNEMWNERESGSGIGMIRFKKLSWASAKDPRRIPTPVINIIEDKIRNEAARLAKPNYKPYVPTAGIRPDAKTREGAELAARAVQSGLEDCRWPVEFHKGCNHMPSYGGAWGASEWETAWDKTIRVGVPGAVQCPNDGCSFALASPQIDDEQSMSMPPGTFKSNMQGAGVTHCPTCPPVSFEEATDDVDEMGNPVTNLREIRPKLEPFFPVDEELNEPDYFGRDMGREVPEGMWRCAVVDDRDMWVENDGVEVQDPQLVERTHVRISTLDYIRMRFDRGFEVEAENEQAIREYHPMFSSDETMAAGAPRRHVRLIRTFRPPWRERDPKTGTMKLNRGRVIYSAGGKTLFFGDFMVESRRSKGKLFPRIHHTYVPHEFTNGGRDLHGTSLFRLQLKTQDMVNMLASMIEDTAKRGGFPSWLVTAAMDLQYQSSGRAQRLITWKPDSEFPQREPKEVGSNQVSTQVMQFMTWAMDRSDITAGRTEVEGGQTPPANVTSGSMLELIAEQTAEQRAQRLERIREALESLWSHGLVLMEEYVREPRDLWYKDDKGEYQKQVWWGELLNGQTQVRIKPTVAYETEVARRENLNTALDDHLLDPNSPIPARARRAALDVLRVPTEVTHDDSIQTEMAEREYQSLLEEPYEEPYIDPEKDSDTDHAEQHGIDMTREAWLDLEDEAELKKYLPKMERWDQPGDPVPTPQTAPPPPGMPSWPLGVQPPMVTVMLPAPSPFDKTKMALRQTGAWPECVELQIFETFRMLVANTEMGAAPVMPGEPTDPQRWPAGKPGDSRDMKQPLQRVLRFRAHKAGHKKRGEQLQMQAASGQPTMAAPEAPSTQAGMMPGPGAGAPQPQQPAPPAAG